MQHTENHELLIGMCVIDQMAFILEAQHVVIDIAVFGANVG